jgi:hypothetical protein
MLFSMSSQAREQLKATSTARRERHAACPGTLTLVLHSINQYMLLVIPMTAEHVPLFGSCVLILVPVVSSVVAMHIYEA